MRRAMPDERANFPEEISVSLAYTSFMGVTRSVKFGDVNAQ